MKKPTPSYESQELRDFGEVLRGRRTIELFLRKLVPAALVKEALEAAVWAPNHHLTEPWRFYLLGKESVASCLELICDIVTTKKDAKMGEFKAQSWSEKPGWLVVTCRKSDDESTQREDYAACCAATQNFMLYLWKAGVGSKWTTGDITRDTRFYDIVGINADEEFVVGLIWYGYPKLTPTQSRKPIDAVLIQLP
ncbi:MAG: nitroreductase [Gammaproteobacteria bacterium]|nr:nitroreductase [Gammaproteobacteria bacterium]MDH3372420.1 nitroreductase [Gammaproteobacteria bacterium]MDH3409131.1 nitroreductase [Gammaproteobacteria bacterium]MDH3551162.1 nitroreductase [Gammaproteobacteria bacterium]